MPQKGGRDRGSDYATTPVANSQPDLSRSLCIRDGGKQRIALLLLALVLGN